MTSTDGEQQGINVSSQEIQVETETGIETENAPADVVAPTIQTPTGRMRIDLENGILSPVYVPVTKVVRDISDAFLPKLEPVPWRHFFLLSLFVAMP